MTRDGCLPPLLCLAGAGGGPSEFRTWGPLLADAMRVAAVALPGRERRVREPVHSTIQEVVREMISAAGELLFKPFALFGYSLGALIMYEVARSLPAPCRENLLHLYVGGQAPPRLPQTDNVCSSDTDDELIRYLRELGGTPEEILGNRAFLRPYLSCLRADLRLVEGYRYTEAAGLQCPLTVFVGRQDSRTDSVAVRDWRHETFGPFKVIELPGGHFSLRTDRDQMLAEIISDMRSPSRGAR